MESMNSKTMQSTDIRNGQRFSSPEGHGTVIDDRGQFIRVEMDNGVRGLINRDSIYKVCQ